MGGHPWFYFVAYQPNIALAMQSLRNREFKAGRYNPAVKFPQFPVTANSPSPGARHPSIEKAMSAADADGTRSVLDIEQVSRQPGHGVVAPVSDKRLLEFFGTAKPSRVMIEADMDFFEDVERGQGIYIIIYKNERPSEIFFAGYSYD
ncbi:MAG TPA: hypothetical protein VI488_19085 [Candidatus Angelobacter sp.]